MCLHRGLLSVGDLLLHQAEYQPHLVAAERSHSVLGQLATFGYVDALGGDGQYLALLLVEVWRQSGSEGCERGGRVGAIGCRRGCPPRDDSPFGGGDSREDGLVLLPDAREHRRLVGHPLEQPRRQQLVLALVVTVEQVEDGGVVQLELSRVFSCREHSPGVALRATIGLSRDSC